MEQPTPKTFILVDGENIDMTLGSMILRDRPRPEQRPRWDRVIAWAEIEMGGPVRGLFFLNASRGLPISFIAALQAIGFVPVPLAGSSDVKVVDVAIQRTLEALRSREGAVVLGSHDSDFRPGVEALLDDGRDVSIIGFPEFVSHELRDLPGIKIFDLEDDVGAFDTGPLPRVRVIPIDRFDPEKFLG